MTATTEVKAPWWEQYKVDLPPGQSGNVSIRPIVIDEVTAQMSGIRAMMKGGRGRITAGTYTGLYRGGSLWMSDTPDEVRDQDRAIRRAKMYGGRVLVNGLGLGMFVKACLAMDTIEHVDVVEIDPDVVNLVGPHYAGERCTIHLADAHDIKWPVGTKWTVAWHDIWQDISSDNTKSMTRLRRRYGNRVDYQECWSEREVKQYRSSGWY